MNDTLSDYYDELKEKNRKEVEEIENLHAELIKALTPEQLKLAHSYIYKSAWLEDYIQIQLKIKIINCCVKIGMQLQQAFIKEDYD